MCYINKRAQNSFLGNEVSGIIINKSSIGARVGQWSRTEHNYSLEVRYFMTYLVELSKTRVPHPVIFMLICLFFSSFWMPAQFL